MIFAENVYARMAQRLAPKHPRPHGPGLNTKAPTSAWPNRLMPKHLRPRGPKPDAKTPTSAWPTRL